MEENQNLPQILYKYTTAEVGLLIIEYLKIRFSASYTFNDPYDTNMPIVLNNSQKIEINNEYLDNCIEKLKKVNFINKKFDLKEISKTNNIDTHSETKPEEYLSSIITKFTKTMRILSLSENNDNLLMWGHYAKNHTGITIGFLKNYIFFKTAKKVIYSKTIPQLDGHLIKDILFENDETYEELEKVILTKSDDWEYEKEWRCLFSTSNNLNYFKRLSPTIQSHYKDLLLELEQNKEFIHQPLVKTCISEIYLGCKINIIDEYKCVNIIKNNLPHVKIYKAKLNKSEFKLDFEEIKI